MQQSDRAGIRALERNDFTRAALQYLEFPLLALLVAIALLLLSPINTPVLPRDEGVFVYIGRGILNGQLPYRDLWDHKGPLIYYLNSLGLLVGRNSLWGVWAIEALMLGAGLVGIYWLLRQVLSRGAALFGMLNWLLGFMIVMSGNVTEEYAILPAVAALGIVVKRPRFSAALLGLLAGVDLLLRPNEAAAPLAAILFLVCEDARLRQWRRAARSLLEFALGFVLIAAAACAFFISNGALPDFLDNALLFNILYISAGGNPATSLLAGLGYLFLPVIFTLAAFTLAVRSGRRVLSIEEQRLLLFAAALLLITLPLSLLAARPYRHYFIAWLLPLALCSAYFWHLLDRAPLPLSVQRPARLLTWSVLLIAVILGIRIRAVPLLAGGPPPEEMRAIRSIQAAVPASEPFFMWGNETSYAVMADRSLSSRYPYLVPLLTPAYGDHVAREVLSTLQAQRPFIIDTSPTDPDIPPLTGDAPNAVLADLYAFVHARYKPVGTIAGKNWIVWAPE